MHKQRVIVCAVADLNPERLVHAVRAIRPQQPPTCPANSGDQKIVEPGRLPENEIRARIIRRRTEAFTTCMDDLETVLDLKVLAEDSYKCDTLLRVIFVITPLLYTKDRSTLEGLVLLLSNSNKELVFLILQVLLTLSGRPRGPTTLKSLIGLDEQLHRLISSDRSQPTKDAQSIEEIAKEVCTCVFGVQQAKVPGCGAAHTSLGRSPIQPKNVILRLYGIRDEVNLG
ncbi:hypothetical protein AHF37_11974 [Paragonimus kellicotti]|nr:hypothetical protein AHF37_11974 [Paragonimus kellicotti]